jgi:hypothetical protein
MTLETRKIKLFLNALTTENTYILGKKLIHDNKYDLMVDLLRKGSK